MTFTDPAFHAHDTEYIRYLASRSPAVTASGVSPKSVSLRINLLTCTETGPPVKELDTNRSRLQSKQGAPPRYSPEGRAEYLREASH